MTVNNIPWENTSRSGVPALSQPQYTEYSRQDSEENKNSQQAVPSFLVVFNGDEVTISSKKRGEENALQGQSCEAVPLSQTGNQIAQRPDLMPEAVLNSTGILQTSENVSDGRSFGPYGIEMNQYAAKRYQQASSLRHWHTSTFEVTV